MRKLDIDQSIRRYRRFVWLLAVSLVIGCTPYLYPQGPTQNPPRFEADHLVMQDGAVLPIRKWMPDGDINAVILALHGFNDYSNAFDLPAQSWAQNGILTYAYDQRGFGRAPHRGRWAGVDTLSDDLIAAADIIKANHPDLPLIVLGESMGGAVVMHTSATEPSLAADRIVMVAPAVWGRETMPGWQRVALSVLANTIPWLEVAPTGIRRKPSDNIKVLRALGRDPLIIKRTRIDAIWGLVNLMDAARSGAPSLNHPSLILYGENEDILPRETWETLIASLPENGDWWLRRYDMGYHMLLRDLRADLVIADVAQFIKDPLLLGPPARANVSRQ